MAGADPNTQWLDGCVVLDPHGFVRTGADLDRDTMVAAGWPLSRAPYLFETSQPRVFAVGGIRPDNMAPWWAEGAAGFGTGSNLYKPGVPAGQVRSGAAAYAAAFDALRR